MKVRITGNYEEMSRAAAACLAREFARNPRLLLCLATGATPARAYELLAPKARKFPELFAQLRVLKLDEWAGLRATDAGSCEAFLRQRVIRPWGISPQRFAGFGCHPHRPKKECERLRSWISRHGPIDLCVLGMSINGHLGFNEPARALCPAAHLARLTEQTRRHSMLSGSTVKPEYGMTLGMAEILQSRQILLLVSGAHKRPAFQRLMRGGIATEFPASFLWLHPQITVLCDRDAAGERKEKEI
jgi:galactosamine-6-phosphate isomerase